MRLRIIIDDLDKDEEGAAEAPLTLTAFRDDDDGTQSRLPLDVALGEEAIFGSNVPTMLRSLAEAWDVDSTAYLGEEA